MMTRKLLPLLLLLLLVAACGEDSADDEEAAATSTPVPATATPTEDAPTVTPIRVSTLPPEATIDMSGGVDDEAPATNTPLPSITPRPSVTSDLNIPVTPATETPVPTSANRVVTISFDDWLEALIEEVPEFTDALDRDTLFVGEEDDDIFVSFEVPGEEDDTPREVRGTVLLQRPDDSGPILVSLVDIRYVDNEIFFDDDDTIDNLETALQGALDNVIVSSVESETFDLVSFQVMQNGIVIEVID
jgi:hypothetical protein